MTIAQLPIHIMLITPIAVALFVLGILVAAGKVKNNGVCAPILIIFVRN